MGEEAAWQSAIGVVSPSLTVEYVLRLFFAFFRPTPPPAKPRQRNEPPQTPGLAGKSEQTSKHGEDKKMGAKTWRAKASKPVNIVGRQENGRPKPLDPHRNPEPSNREE